MPEFKFPALIIKQRDSDESPKFALFSSPVGEILRWAAIRRRHEDQGGPQRRLSKAKIGAVKRFLSKDERNTIPPAITVTLDIPNEAVSPIEPDKEGLESLFEIRIQIDEGIAEADKPGIVIDGQHRILGMNEFDPESRINVVALLNVDDMEKAFQFLVINNKASRVPGDLLRTLALDYEATDLQQRLETARLTLSEQLHFVGVMDKDEASPFRGHITLEADDRELEQRFISASAIENSVAYIVSKKVKDFESEDTLCMFFYAIWAPIIERWPGLWSSESKLTHKVSVVAVTIYFTDALISKYDWDELDISSPDDVRATVERILNTQSKEFWETDWTITINDSKVVRDQLIEALKKISRNIRADLPWNSEIELVAP